MSPDSVELDAADEADVGYISSVIKGTSFPFG